MIQSKKFKASEYLYIYLQKPYKFQIILLIEYVCTGLQELYEDNPLQ